jgi:hypothetical protein
LGGESKSPEYSLYSSDLYPLTALNAAIIYGFRMDIKWDWPQGRQNESAGMVSGALFE